MPLAPPLLQAALAEAFDKGMFVFAKTIADGPVGTDVSENARELAAATFASIAAPAIDLYIKSATVIVAPGIVTALPIPAPPFVTPLYSTTAGIGVIT